jgi:hypothetical protein
MSNLNVGYKRKWGQRMGLEGSALTWKRRRWTQEAPTRRCCGCGKAGACLHRPCCAAVVRSALEWKESSRRCCFSEQRKISRKAFLFIYLAPNQDISLEKSCEKSKKRKQKIKLAQKQKRARVWGCLLQTRSRIRKIGARGASLRCFLVKNSNF